MRPPTSPAVFLTASGAALLAVAVIATGGAPVAAAPDGPTLLAWSAQDDDSMDDTAGMAAMDAPSDALDPEICSACHGEVVESLHGAHATQASCADCHGDGTAHVESGGTVESIFSFGPSRPTLAKAQVCLGCHGDQHSRFPGSPHAMAGVGCSECHTAHGETAAGPHQLRQVSGLDRPDRRTESLTLASTTCRECHGAVFSQFELAEGHRLQEGILGCESCHNPHEPTARGMLAGALQPGCADCHTDKTGPFVFEHGSSMVEGCVACHTPHGSTERHMLKFQRTAQLCYSCHPQVPGFHARFTLDTVCTNCHTSIHGSNFHAAFLE